MQGDPGLRDPVFMNEASISQPFFFEKSDRANCVVFVRIAARFPAVVGSVFSA